MTEHIEVRLTAPGAATACARAKEEARRDYRRIRTVCSVRPVAEQSGSWVVVLAVEGKRAVGAQR